MNNNQIKISGYVELLAGPIISLIISVVVFIYRSSFEFLYGKEFNTALVTITTMLFAFLLTILTIILQGNNTTMKAMKNNKLFNKFIKFNKRIVFLFFANIILSLIVVHAPHVFEYFSKKISSEISLISVISIINFYIFTLALLDTLYFTIMFYSIILDDHN